VPISFAQVRKNLEDFVRQTVRLDTPNSQGISLRKQLEANRAFFKKQGRTDEQLEKQFPLLIPTEIDAGFEHIMEAFNNLSMSRQYDSMGNPQSFSYLELKAYCEMTGTEFDPFELETLRHLDYSMINEWSKTQNNDKGEAQ
jgi:hypothetical protein